MSLHYAGSYTVFTLNVLTFIQRFVNIRARTTEGHMPTLKSSKKRLRQNIERRARNRTEKSKMRTIIKKAIVAINENATDAEESLAAAYGALDKAAKKGIIHTRQADRRKARLAARLKKAKVAGK